MFLNVISNPLWNIFNVFTKDEDCQKYILENSWYVKEEGMHDFFCLCGHHDIIASSKEQKNPYLDAIKFKKEEIDFSKIPDIYHPNNSCSVCGNEHYLDMNALLFDDKTKFWRDVKWDYQEIVNSNSWVVVAFVSIPRFDYDRDKIIVEQIELAKYSVGYMGDSYYKETLKPFFRKRVLIDEKYYRIDRILKEDIDKKMVDVMLLNPLESLVWLNGEERELKKLFFFLKNSKIRFKDAFYWRDKELFLGTLNRYQYLELSLDYILNNRKEKSLRKAQFQSYKEMMSLGGYSPMADYIFSQSIDDVNHLVKILKMDAKIKIKLFDECDFENIDYFISFLKRQYQEQHLVRFWLSITDEDLQYFLLRDTIEMFGNKTIRDEIEQFFQKTALNIRAIHHEMTKYTRELKRLDREKLLEYSDFLYENQVTKEDMDYMLPHSRKQLHKWGEILHNCIFSYFDRIEMGKSTIFGIFIDGNLTYAIELSTSHNIIQATSSYNQSIPKGDRKKIDRWHKEVYLKNLVQSSD